MLFKLFNCKIYRVMYKIKLLTLIFLTSIHLLLINASAYAFNPREINVVSYPSIVDNTPIADINIRLRNENQEPYNRSLRDDILLQATYLYTPEYCSRLDLQKKYPDIPYKFTCELNKTKLPFILAEIKPANKHAEEILAKQKANSHWENFKDLKITKNVVTRSLKYSKPNKIYKSKLKVAPYYGDNQRIAKLWNEIFFIFPVYYDSGDYPLSIIDAFLGNYCYSNSWHGSCSLHRFNCIGNNHIRSADLRESGNYFDMNQLSKLSNEGETTAKDLVALFNSNLLLDKENNFLGLTYTISEGQTHTEQIINLDKTSTKNIHIKNGNFSSKALLKDTFTGNVFKIMMLPLAIIVTPIALYQMGRSGQ